MWKKLKIFENNEEKRQIDEKPIDKEYIEKAIKLIKIANDVGCDFEICFLLSIGNFNVSAGAFDDIKMVSNKKKPDELLIQSHDMLMSNSTQIPIDNIININIQISYNASLLLERDENV